MNNPTTTQTTPVTFDGAIDWKDKLIDYVIGHSGALLTALAVIIVGLIVARWVGNVMNRWLERKTMEPPVRMLVSERP